MELVFPEVYFSRVIIYRVSTWPEYPVTLVLILEKKPIKEKKKADFSPRSNFHLNQIFVSNNVKSLGSIALD